MTLILSVFLLAFVACNSKPEHLQEMQNQIDSLKLQITNTYKPGFGEFMSSIQMHHSKLWFAGMNENWKLADFEVHEIMETVENIQKFQQERKESRAIEMIQPALDSVDDAIQQQNLISFKSSFILLTNTCNNCHQDTEFGFNVVKIPETQSFSNQDFRIKK